MNKLELRPVTTTPEFQQVAGLARQIWTQHYTPLIGKEQVDYMLESLQSVQRIERDVIAGILEYYVIWWEQLPVGYVGIGTGERGLFLSKLYLLESARGNKIASQVIHLLEVRCRKDQIPGIWLTCNIHNKDTLAAYQQLGFQIVDTQLADIGGGYVMDDYILEKAVD